MHYLQLHRGGQILSGITFALVLAGFFSPLANALPLEPRNILKVMIVGNSISHGLEGDYTWRYRIWQWFELSNIPVQFVGPYIGTVQPDEPLPPQQVQLLDTTAPDTPKTSGGYAEDVDPAFLSNCNHFAAWGRQLAQDKALIHDQIIMYQPDILLVELGFNDMGWFVSGVNGTLKSMKNFIDNSRAAKSNIKMVIANVPERTYIRGRDDLVNNTLLYNLHLPRYLNQWSTDESHLFVADFKGNYNCTPIACPAGHDGLHPNALGEFEIARAYSQVLHTDFGLGSSELSVPKNIPSRPCPVPTNIKAVTSATRVTVTWDAVYGAFGYHVKYRSSGGPWSIWNRSTNRYDSVVAAGSETFDYRIATSCGDGVPYRWSDIVSAVPHPPSTLGLKNIITSSTASGFDKHGDPPPGPWKIDL